MRLTWRSTNWLATNAPSGRDIRRAAVPVTQSARSATIGGTVRRGRGAGGEETGGTGGAGCREVRRALAEGRTRYQCGDCGASERSIMNQTGHRSVQMVRRYIRDGSLFRENSAGNWGSNSVTIRYPDFNDGFRVLRRSSMLMVVFGAVASWLHNSMPLESRERSYRRLHIASRIQTSRRFQMNTRT